MAGTVHFCNQQIGDGVITIQAGTRPLTPPVFSMGLFQDIASVNSDSRNMLNVRQIAVHMKRDGVVAFDYAAAAVQQLLGQSGDLEIRDDGNVVFLAVGWWLQDAPAPNTLPGFGGRFVKSWPLIFVGASEPVYTL